MRFEVIIVVVHVEAVKIYVAEVQALRKNERRVKTVKLNSRNHLKINIFHILNPNKFHYVMLIKIFPTTPKAHFNSSVIFSYDLI
jgi:hypothetical protein